MPLLDHFHPPLSDGQFWESFHSLWIAAMVEQLNGNILPQGYLAQAQVHIGGWFEVDVATFETAPLGANGGCTFGRRRRRNLGAAGGDAGFPGRLSRRIGGASL